MLPFSGSLPTAITSESMPGARNSIQTHSLAPSPTACQSFYWWDLGAGPLSTLRLFEDRCGSPKIVMCLPLDFILNILISSWNVFEKRNFTRFMFNQISVAIMIVRQ